ncbi:hypothetical protein [Olsenella sp. oral taxon 807]|uniref:hypothetical protein n=1 Tax=Olsenella sp. oral taxon 807 TaxID=712411 RepID=UPI000AD31CBE|nr:hypothetical protein [Olsenella sp. oral taxon 807]
MSGGGARSCPEGRPSAHLSASLGNDPVSPAAAAAAEGYDGWARDRTADGGHALAGKWPRRLMGAFLALAPNPIDTRALATRALATAPESAGIGDMQGKATPGLGPWAGASPLLGRMLPLPRRRPRRMRPTPSTMQRRYNLDAVRRIRESAR